jgi:hypothetical protein
VGSPNDTEPPSGHEWWLDDVAFAQAQELDEVVTPQDISLTSSVIRAASPDGAALKVLFVQYWVDLDIGMTDASFCLSAQNCAGHGELNPPVVLTQCRLHTATLFCIFIYVICLF